MVNKIPGVGPLLFSFRRMRGSFKSSSTYWERRYKTGGNSGAGSYGRLAQFKAGFLNEFVDQHPIASVIEYGCGDGAQLKLARYTSYTGVDVSAKAVEICRGLFADDASKQFLQLDDATPDLMADLSLSLDVIYHLVEDSVFDAYMRRLFESARLFVIVYASNTDQSWPAKHVRHRKFTRWVEQNKPEWLLQFTFKNAYPYNPVDSEQTSFADFYVFAQRCDQHMQ
jgi:SAM-dependent methyltransferase